MYILWSNDSKGVIEMEKNCLDCLYCKMVNNRSELKCSEGHWEYRNGAPRVIKLQQPEANGTYMTPRKYFDQAQKCSSFSSMDD